MKKIKTAWLNFILHISAKINKSKEAIVEGGILQTLRVALKIVFLEVLLLIVSLPIYIFISPASFSTDKKEVQKYRLKRIISLVSVCTFIVIFLVTSILSGGIFLVVPAAELRADAIGWSFDSPKDYIYDFSKIQIIDGLVLFNPEDIAVKGLTEEFAESMTFKESLFEKLAKKTTETSAETTSAETTAAETTAAETTAAETTAAETTAAETTLEKPAETTTETTTESVPESTGKTDETVQSSTEKLSATSKATVQAVNSLIVPDVASWDSFTEVSSKNGGEIYYQLSDDGGQNWFYWNNKWVKAGENDYNTAKEINGKIRDFPINTGKILFKAFFITDYKSEMQLLDISIAFSQKIDETIPKKDAEGNSNQAPTADAGGPYSVEVNSTVKLDGSASSDTDGSIISYKWKIIEGPGSLSGNNSPIVTYKAPKKLDSEMEVTVELTVVDDGKESDTGKTAIMVVLVSEAAPIFTSAAITGTAKIGVVLTAAGIGYSDINGDLEGTPLYQWMICSTADGTYTEIPGAVSSTYIPVTADSDNFIKVLITPTALTGKSPGIPVTSIATEAVLTPEEAPTFSSVMVTGTAKVGATLKANSLDYFDKNGDLEGTPLYQWMICSTADGTYTEIPGAVSSTYIPVITDLDKFIKAIVTPVAQTGTSPGMPVESIATAAVIKMTLDELKNEGAVSPDFNMWKDDPASGSILGSGGLIYINNPNSDYSVTVRAKLQTGTLGGYGIFFDTTTDEIDGSKDNGYILQIDRGFGDGAVLIRPRINGVEKTPVKIINSSSDGAIPKKSIDPLWWTAEHAVELKVSTVSIGESTNNKKIMVYIDGKFVLNYDYQVAIPKQDQKYYTGLRSWSVKSNFYSIALIPEAAPTFSGATITGTAKVGTALTAAGTSYNDVNGDLAATPLYQWTICDTANGTYLDIPGATKSTYKPEFADSAKFIKVKVTPTALTGTSPGTTLISAATAPVKATEGAPTFTGAEITGTAKVGSVLSAEGNSYNDVNGDLAGTPLYQWMICNTAAGVYTEILGATYSDYKPVTSDLGKFIKVIVTPVAQTGTSPGASVTSVATTAISAAEEAPTFTGAKITGTIKVGSVLTAVGIGYNDLNGDLAATPLYQWIIYDIATGIYTDILGATDNTYMPVTADLGKFIKVIVTPTALSGTSRGTSVTSAATTEILAAEAAPSFTGAVITGTAKVGIPLTAAGSGYNDVNGDLAGAPFYQWMISSTAGGAYTEISGATNNIYTPITADLGKFIKVTITPTAQAGTSPGMPMTSSATAAVIEYTPSISLGSTFSEISSGMIKLIEDYYAEYGKFPRSFSPYNYTDLGLIESEWNVAHNNIIYSPTGNRLNVKPADGYGFEAVNKVTGKTIRMPYTLKYNFVYYIDEGVWYYHKQDVNNVIDISTFKVYSVETGEIVIEQAAPTFTSAAITGTGKVGTELTASGMGYSDVNKDLEATPLYQWKISNTADGTYNDIPGATNSAYTPAAIDLGKFIKVMITPTAQTGTSPGEPRSSAAIECYSGKPKITINSAAQQTDHGNVYINYTLVDAEKHAIDLSNYEYSLTGDFTGEESSMTAAASDDKHDGSKGLSSSAAGVEHNFVWDAMSDLPGAHNLNLYIRLKPYDGIEQGEFAVFNAYIPGFKKPAISNISALQTAGTNKVAVSYDLSADNGKLLVALEISEDGGTTWTTPVSGITGDIGPEITTGTGRNIIWDAAVDFKGKDKPDMQIRLTATGVWQNTSDYAYSPYFNLDTSAPLGLNDFLGVSADKSFIVWSWTPVVSETNFKYYKISYGQDLEDVRSATGSAAVWDASDDIDLSIAGTSGTIITGLSEGTGYYAKIWAIDNFGNQATVLESQFITKNDQDDSAAVPPFTPILNQPSESTTQSGILVSGIADINSDNDLYVDGEIVIAGFAQTQSDGKFNGTIKLDKGKHEIYVMSKDRDGNSSKRSNTINVDIDFGSENNLTSLIFPTITDKEETDEATIIKDVYKAAESSVLQRPQVIEVKGIDAGNNIKFIGKGIANSEVIVFIHSEQVIAYRVQVNENGDWSLNHSQDNAELAEGDHEVYALTLDAKSQAKSRISDIKDFQVKVSPLAVFLSYFDLPTTLLTIFVLLAGIVVFIIWRKKQTKTNKNNGNTA